MAHDQTLAGLLVQAGKFVTHVGHTEEPLGLPAYNNQVHRDLTKQFVKHSLFLLR